MSLLFPERHHNGMDSIRLPLDKELSPNDAHVRCFGSPSDPEFHGISGRRVDD